MITETELHQLGYWVKQRNMYNKETDFNHPDEDRDYLLALTTDGEVIITLHHNDTRKKPSDPTFEAFRKWHNEFV